MTAQTLSFRDDRAELFAAVDLAAEFTAAALTQGRNRQWPCPSPHHAQTGTTPPVAITTGPDGYDLWHCHGCGAGGTVVDLYRLTRGVDTAEAFALVRAKVGTRGHHRPPRRAPEQSAPPDPDAGRLTGDQADDVLGTYLEARQWSTETADVFGLYAVRGRWGRPRVRHPYRVAGEVRWWQDRAVYDVDPGHKWDSPRGLPRCLYAHDLHTALTWAEDTPCLWVCEGPADVIALWHAAPGAACVGIPGTSGADRWAPCMGELEVLIATDPDDAGDQAAHDLAVGIHTAGGWSARLRPPADLDDWRREVGSDGLAAGLQALADAADWWTP